MRNKQRIEELEKRVDGLYESFKIHRDEILKLKNPPQFKQGDEITTCKKERILGQLHAEYLIGIICDEPYYDTMDCCFMYKIYLPKYTKIIQRDEDEIILKKEATNE